MGFFFFIKLDLNYNNNTPDAIFDKELYAQTFFKTAHFINTLLFADVYMN